MKEENKKLYAVRLKNPLQHEYSIFNFKPEDYQVYGCIELKGDNLKESRGLIKEIGKLNKRLRDIAIKEFNRSVKK